MLKKAMFHIISRMCRAEIERQKDMASIVVGSIRVELQPTIGTAVVFYIDTLVEELLNEVHNLQDIL